MPKKAATVQILNWKTLGKKPTKTPPVPPVIQQGKLFDEEIETEIPETENGNKQPRESAKKVREELQAEISELRDALAKINAQVANLQTQKPVASQASLPVISDEFIAIFGSWLKQQDPDQFVSAARAQLKQITKHYKTATADGIMFLLRKALESPEFLANIKKIQVKT